MKYLSVLLTAIASMAIISCTNPKIVGASHTSASAQSDTASAYRLGDTASYQTASSAKRQRFQKHVNALKAPSNQTYYFAFNSNNIATSDIPAMTQQANYLSTHPRARIRLEGNTDSRGSREYNIALGWRRDQAVARFFMQRGVLQKQIQMVSYGKEHPVMFGNTPKDWALNRRVNLIYKVT